MSEVQHSGNDYHELPSEEKLQILRHEIFGVCVRLEAYAHLLLLIDKDKINQLQPDSFETIEKIERDVNEIYDIVVGLTD